MINIPIMTCFDNNYAAPAAVCFYSLLSNANCNYFYKLYVLQNDITLENKSKLEQIIHNFHNASIEFIDMQNKFDDLFNKTKVKGHFSKEMYYKFIAPVIFPQYERILITDVDVVFLGDISNIFVNFGKDNDNYLAACKTLFNKTSKFINFYDKYKQNFTQEEINYITYCGGLYVFNLKKMRQDKCYENFIVFAKNNAHRLIQPEQDTIHLVCRNKIKLLPSNTLVCSYSYDMYKNQDYENDMYWDRHDVIFALACPLQLHYATEEKPWNIPRCIKSEIWWNLLKKTPFFFDVLKKLEFKKNPRIKKLLSISIYNKRFKIIMESR